VVDQDDLETIWKKVGGLLVSVSVHNFSATTVFDLITFIFSLHPKVQPME